MKRRIAIIGAGGFVGGGLFRCFDDGTNHCLAVNRGDPLPDGHVDIVIDCNGEGRRFWSNENPLGSFRASVQSVAERVMSIDTDVYVYISTVDVYGAARAERSLCGEEAVIDIDRLDTYGAHKFLAETLVRKHATRPLILRCGTLIGDGLKKNPVWDLLHGSPLRMTPDSTISLLGLAGLEAALRALLQADETGIFNVAASASVSVDEVRDIIAKYRALAASVMPVHNDLITAHYDVNLDKLGAYVNLPTSAQALQTYLSALADRKVETLK